MRKCSSCGEELVYVRAVGTAEIPLEVHSEVYDVVFRKGKPVSCAKEGTIIEGTEVQKFLARHRCVVERKGRTTK